MSRVIQATGIVSQLLNWLNPDEQKEVVRSLVNGYGVRDQERLPPLYTDQQVAERYNVSVYTIREWLGSGKIKGFKEGRQWLIREPDIAAFEERR
ncbi:helix-turn-helix domain-containing protein [Cohnella sp. LGH]|uniref:helix-turn-helix domain-containing protein n=1 Tax=Cohnella sp. LGH TaxID=1619153 RepID=UPI001ADCAAF3|nr:helix-turn-helix domain-containing protein [Cohnella sp. LGH]QTH44920.1 helix-turn-helix domain-containing protein [Cohnella sp. LGH]